MSTARKAERRWPVLGSSSTYTVCSLLGLPSTGLHFADVARLLEVLNRLVDAGHSVIVIEHNLDVLRSADWIIDLGPEGGAAGGTVVAEGTPEDIARNRHSHTGKFLKPYFSNLE